MTISSINGSASDDNCMSHCIRKADVNQFTKFSAVAWAAKGIRVIAIAPGMIRAPIFLTIDATADDSFKIFKSKFPVKPSEIALSIVPLANEP